MIASVIALLSLRGQASAPFLSPTFGDHMVLQRGLKNSFWGWTTPGAAVTVKVGKNVGSGVADASGKWLVKVSPPPVGGPYDVAVDGPQHVELHDVLVGDVWICSGQSNMEMGIGIAANGPQEIAAANYPNIRLAMVPRAIEFAPRAVNGFSWAPCSPESVAKNGWAGFSAAAYYFGRELNKRLNVPIGLVETCWGGTIAEAWTSKSGLLPLKDFDRDVTAVDQTAAGTRPASEKPLDPNNPNMSTVLYNGMIYPLQPLAIKGAIWYQGESNGGRAYQYRKLLPAMIEDWRSKWGEGDFPFFIVQLANWRDADAQPAESDWAELREAQSMTADGVKNAGLAVAIDIGNPSDIHPKDKQSVGLRLALAALHTAYGKKIEYSGPTYKSFTKEGSAIRLTFGHTTGGLKAKGDILSGFAVAGADHKFHWAYADIDGSSVIVKSPEVSDPVAVRYAWGNNPVATLYNGADLPAVPFRTDTWPGVTINNK